MWQSFGVISYAVITTFHLIRFACRSGKRWTSPPPPPPASHVATPKSDDDDAPTNIVKKETSNVGRVTLKTYATYVQAGGRLALPIVFILMSLGQAGIVLSDYTLLEWVDTRKSAELIGELRKGFFVI